MNRRRYRIVLELLVMAPVMLVLSVFWACNEDPDDPETPFTRLLPAETLYSQIFDRAIQYAVLLPEDYTSSEKSYPVVYLLHGFGDEYSAWYKSGLIQYYSDQSAATIVPMIFVMPQGFNSYYVNRSSGTLPYMDFFATELVTHIDSAFRTKKDPSQRAVMGYSMGGYGALILPVKHPELFSIGVPLSMSFRTDNQYINEPQEVFDNQWGLIFGGYGASGEARLTDYFKDHSPFHFFDQDDLSDYLGLKFLFDCGDDEEALSVTNGALHNLMNDRAIPHEFRVRSGAHTWDYWHASLPEALRFISFGFQGHHYPPDPEPIDPGTLIPSDQYHLEHLDGHEKVIGLFKPPVYDLDTLEYPVIYFIHDSDGLDRQDQAIGFISLLYNSMASGRIPYALIAEIPCESGDLSSESLQEVIHHIDEHYRTTDNKKGRVLMGNNEGATAACALLHEFSDSFNACFLFGAELVPGTTSVADVFYYLDYVDQSVYCQGNFDLYLDLRAKGEKHEYRVRQGTPGFPSILNGMDAAMGYLSQELTRP